MTSHDQRIPRPETPTRARSRRARPVAVTVAAVAAIAGVWVALRPVRAATALEQPAARWVTAIPFGTYNTLVVSPAGGPLGPDGQPRPGQSARFTLRTRTANGIVEDFVFHVPLGETLVLPFPSGLVLNADAMLIGPSSVRFAAWGQTDRGLVPAEDVGRDPLDDRFARDREREYESFLRERDRTRVR